MDIPPSEKPEENPDDVEVTNEPSNPQGVQGILLNQNDQPIGDTEIIQEIQPKASESHPSLFEQSLGESVNEFQNVGLPENEVEGDLPENDELGQRPRLTFLLDPAKNVEPQQGIPPTGIFPPGPQGKLLPQKIPFSQKKLQGRKASIVPKIGEKKEETTTGLFSNIKEIFLSSSSSEASLAGLNAALVHRLYDPADLVRQEDKGRRYSHRAMHYLGDRIDDVDLCFLTMKPRGLPADCTIKGNYVTVCRQNLILGPKGSQIEKVRLPVLKPEKTQSDDDNLILLPGPSQYEATRHLVNPDDPEGFTEYLKAKAEWEKIRPPSVSSGESYQSSEEGTSVKVKNDIKEQLLKEKRIQEAQKEAEEAALREAAEAAAREAAEAAENEEEEAEPNEEGEPSAVPGENKDGTEENKEVTEENKDGTEENKEVTDENGEKKEGDEKPEEDKDKEIDAEKADGDTAKVPGEGEETEPKEGEPVITEPGEEGIGGDGEGRVVEARTLDGEEIPVFDGDTTIPQPIEIGEIVQEEVPAPEIDVELPPQAPMSILDLPPGAGKSSWLNNPSESSKSSVSSVSSKSSSSSSSSSGSSSGSSKSSMSTPTPKGKGNKEKPKEPEHPPPGDTHQMNPPHPQNDHQMHPMMGNGMNHMMGNGMNHPMMGNGMNPMMGMGMGMNPMMGGMGMNPMMGMMNPMMGMGMMNPMMGMGMMNPMMGMGMMYPPPPPYYPPPCYSCCYPPPPCEPYGYEEDYYDYEDYCSAPCMPMPTCKQPCNYGGGRKKCCKKTKSKCAKKAKSKKTKSKSTSESYNTKRHSKRSASLNEKIFNTSNPIYQGEDMNFTFLPQKGCCAEVTMTMDPDEPDPLLYSVTNRTMPVVCCQMPPALMIDEPMMMG